jgi:hypothetical protein
MSSDDPQQRTSDRDRIVESYRDILTELRLLTTVSALMFGFLLATQSLAASGVQEWLYGVGLVLNATATVVFVLPVVYHRAQYPYHDWEKFQARSHFFIIAGTPMLAAGLYLSIALALWPRWGGVSLAVAALPLLIAGAVYQLRRLS